MRSRGLAEGGARACALRVAVRCDARVEAGERGLAAGRARASCVTGLRIFCCHTQNHTAVRSVRVRRSVGPDHAAAACEVTFPEVKRPIL